MTTSDSSRDVFVWTWLPGAEEPVVAGRLVEEGGSISFNYGSSYLGRSDAISLYEPELPLRRGLIRPRDGLSAPGCIVDGRPDSWGQRVILDRLTGHHGRDADTGELDTITYLIESGSDRLGAMDFQRSSKRYVPRGDDPATLEDLALAAEKVDAGEPLPAVLQNALIRGSSIGGARPKAPLVSEGRSLIAKFASTSDLYPVVQGEFIAMRLAARAGLNVAPVELADVLDRKALLVERFDRVPGSRMRRAVVSALTILELDEMSARYASYFDLAQVARARFKDGAGTLSELFARITFNVLVGNTDDHARNHAAFWDGRWLTLTPAYDICPQVRTGGEATQAMWIGDVDAGDRFKFSQVAGCVDRAHLYQLDESEAREIVDQQIEVIRSSWQEVADDAELSGRWRTDFMGRQFLNPYALEGYRA